MDRTAKILPIPLPALIVLSALLYCVYSLLKWKARQGGRPLPPGPKPVPFLGNIYDLPRARPWIKYRDLCAQFGDILHLRYPGQSIVVLGSAEVIGEYLDKRSSITSERTQSPLVELVGGEMTMGFLPPDERWKQNRRVFQHFFSQKAIKEYEATQRAYVRGFLAKLLRNPANDKDHIRFTFAATLLKLLYDIDVTGGHDPHIALVEGALESLHEVSIPGKYLVETFPFMKHVPAWLPGAGFQRKLAGLRAVARTMRDLPVALVKQAMQRGEGGPSIVRSFLEDSERSGAQGKALREQEETIKSVGMDVIAGGSDTTFSALQTVLLAMSLYPDVLRKAHAELDAVVGPRRLPDFHDKHALVYVCAIIREALRWMPVTPFGVPHALATDDDFRGFFLPAGTLLLPNIWACMHDPAVYKDPEEFCPDRFIAADGQLDPDVRDPFAFVFGFGRRICPGKHFGESSLFINVASLLHVFDIGPPLDDAGQPIRIMPRMTEGPFMTYPEDSRCTIRPRSAEAEALILTHTADS